MPTADVGMRIANTTLIAIGWSRVNHGVMHPHRKRCRRLDQPGDAHSVTFSCLRRCRYSVATAPDSGFSDPISALQA